MSNILMIASNPAVSPVTGWPIGFWWAELTHAHKEFLDAGHTVTIASPEGGEIQGDGFSDPDDESGYSADDSISKAFKNAPEKMALLKDTTALSDVTPDDFDAIFVVGGQGPMVTMVDDANTLKFVSDFYETGKITAAVCHGTAVLLNARLSNGDLLVKGKKWTGFADAEEEYAEKAVGMKIQPFWIETEAHKIPDTEFVTGGVLAEFAVRDGTLITGQQQVSSAAAARKVNTALKS